MSKCDCPSDFMCTPLSDKEMLWKATVSKESTNPTILARIYIPKQKPGELYSLCDAIEKGTVYPELYQPYNDKNCCRTGADGEEILPDSVILPGNIKECGSNTACKKEGEKYGKCK